MERKELSLEDLPDELIINIGNHMSIPTLEAMRLASSRYRYIYRDLYNKNLTKIYPRIRNLTILLGIKDKAYFTIRYGDIEEGYYSEHDKNQVKKLHLEEFNLQMRHPVVHVNIFTIKDQKITNYRELSNLTLLQVINHLKSLDGLDPLYYTTYNGKSEPLF